MTTRPPTILAMGGGGFMMEPENPLLDAHVLALTGVDRARICFLGTASADRASTLEDFHRTFAAFGAEPSHVTLPWVPDEDGPPELGRPDGAPNVADIRAHLSAQHAIYVGGGNTRRMLAIWRHYGVDEILHDLWASGAAVLAGVSAGALCWFEAGVTDSIPGRLTPMQALGWLPGSFCPHYDGEPGRKPTFEALVTDGTLPTGYGVDDGCALQFEGDRFVRAVSSRPGASWWQVARVFDGARTMAGGVEGDYLGDPA